jgi:hypothetical protein
MTAAGVKEPAISGEQVSV